MSGFGVYRLRFEDTVPTYCTVLMKAPVAGLGALVEGAEGRGLVFQMTLPPRDFEAMSSPAIQEHLHGFGMPTTTSRYCTAKSTPNCFEVPRPFPVAAHGSPDTPRPPGRERTPLATPVRRTDSAHSPFDLDAVVHR